jgi:hypothetical protein
VMGTGCRCAAVASGCLLLGLFLCGPGTTRAASEEVHLPGSGDASGALAALALDEPPIALLAGRLTAKMPAASKVQPRRDGIMAAPESSEEETRVMLDAKSERLVLMAYELYALAGPDFEKAVRADVAARWGKAAAIPTLETLAVEPPLAAVLVSPQPADGKREANLVLGLYIKSGDGSVQFLAFYVNPDGARDAAGVTALAKRIAATVHAGTRGLPHMAGDRIFATRSAVHFGITVPDGYVTSTQEGPDFWVYRLRKLVPLDQPPQACGIYLGDHPSHQYRQARVPREQVNTLKGRLLGQDAEWQSWSKADRSTNEAIVPYPRGTGMSVHVFCSAGSEVALKGLRAVVETLRLER